MERTVIHYEADAANHAVKKIIRRQREDIEGTAGWVTTDREVHLLTDASRERAYLDAERIRHNQLRADYVAWIAELDAAVTALGA
mgnify:CR=1 FL=1